MESPYCLAASCSIIIHVIAMVFSWNNSYSVEQTCSSFPSASLLCLCFAVMPSLLCILPCVYCQSLLLLWEG